MSEPKAKDSSASKPAQNEDLKTKDIPKIHQDEERKAKDIPAKTHYDEVLKAKDTSAKILHEEDRKAKDTSTKTHYDEDRKLRDVSPKKHPEEERSKSELLVDLHIYQMPSHLWVNRHSGTTADQIIPHSQSVGFIRTHPESTLQTVRFDVERQLGDDALPHDFVFLRCIGRSFTQVKTRQEKEMKVKYFLPPVTPGPELYVLDAAAADPNRASVMSSSMDHEHADVTHTGFSVYGNTPRFQLDQSDTPGRAYDKQLERVSLLKEMERLRMRRDYTEMQRQALLRRAGQLKNKSTANRTPEVREMWKKRYYEEKKKMGPRDEHSQSLRQELDALNYKFIAQLVTLKDDIKRMPGDVDYQKRVDRANEKIHTTCLENDIEELQARLQTTKARLTTEMKLRTQSDYELQLLKADCAQPKPRINQEIQHRQEPQAPKFDTFRDYFEQHSQRDHDRPVISAQAPPPHIIQAPPPHMIQSRPPPHMIPERGFQVIRRPDGSPELIEITPRGVYTQPYPPETEYRVQYVDGAHFEHSYRTPRPKDRGSYGSETDLGGSRTQSLVPVVRSSHSPTPVIYRALTPPVGRRANTPPQRAVHRTKSPPPAGSDWKRHYSTPPPATNRGGEGRMSHREGQHSADDIHHITSSPPRQNYYTDMPRKPPVPRLNRKTTTTFQDGRGSHHPQQDSSLNDSQSTIRREGQHSDDDVHPRATTRRQSITQHNYPDMPRKPPVPKFRQKIAAFNEDVENQAQQQQQDNSSNVSNSTGLAETITHRSVKNRREENGYPHHDSTVHPGGYNETISHRDVKSPKKTHSLSPQATRSRGKEEQVEEIAYRKPQWLVDNQSKFMDNDDDRTHREPEKRSIGKDRTHREPEKRPIENDRNNREPEKYPNRNDRMNRESENYPNGNDKTNREPEKYPNGNDQKHREPEKYPNENIRTSWEHNKHPNVNFGTIPNRPPTDNVTDKSKSTSTGKTSLDRNDSVIYPERVTHQPITPSILKHAEDSILVYKRLNRAKVERSGPEERLTELEKTFRLYSKKAGGKKATRKSVQRWFRDSGVLGKQLNSEQVDAAFLKVKPTESQLISTKEMYPLIDEMSLKYMGDNQRYDAVQAKKMLIDKLSNPPNKLPAVTPKLNNGNAFARLTDHTKYTGTHKERFDETGKGKGIENRVDYNGYVQNNEDVRPTGVKIV